MTTPIPWWEVGGGQRGGPVSIALAAIPSCEKTYETVCPALCRRASRSHRPPAQGHGLASIYAWGQFLLFPCSLLHAFSGRASSPSPSFSRCLNRGRTPRHISQKSERGPCPGLRAWVNWTAVDPDLEPASARGRRRGRISGRRYTQIWGEGKKVGGSAANQVICPEAALVRPRFVGCEALSPSHKPRHRLRPRTSGRLPSRLGALVR